MDTQRREGSGEPMRVQGGMCIGHFLPAWVTKGAAGSRCSADMDPTAGSGPAQPPGCQLLLARR